MGLMYNTQTDIEWKKDIMTQSTWIDIIGRYGCLVTSLSNIMQSILGSRFTPKDLNKILQLMRGYKYLNNIDTPENQASFLEWDIIKKYFKDLIDINLRVNINQFSNDNYYIARVVHKYGGSHYINVMTKSRKFFWCFDVEDGKIKAYKPEDVVYLHEIKIKG
jgi:phosphoenolpyruvate synthase/pyruvate phosphate dikinase